jgi:hypothetical protein
VLREQPIDKDLLVVGLIDVNPVLRRWAHRAPLVVGPTGGRAQMPAQASELLSTLAGRRAQIELEAARALTSSLKRFSAVMGFESPLQRGRSVVVVTATTAAELPALPDLKGFAASQERAGDLLVASSGQRWMFHVGPSYGLGRLHPWTQLRWFVANHLALLLPALLLGALLLAIPMKAFLARRSRERLAVGEAPEEARA